MVVGAAGWIFLKDAYSATKDGPCVVVDGFIGTTKSIKLLCFFFFS